MLLLFKCKQMCHIDVIAFKFSSRLISSKGKSNLLL